MKPLLIHLPSYPQPLILAFEIEEGNFLRRQHLESTTTDSQFADIQAKFIELSRALYLEDNPQAGQVANLAAEALGKARTFLPPEPGPVLTHLRTTAKIYYRGAEGFHLLVAKGEAHLSPEDFRDDEEGRQWALFRALKQLDPEAAGGVLAAYLLEAPDRQWRHATEDAEWLALGKLAVPFLIDAQDSRALREEAITLVQTELDQAYAAECRAA